MVLILFRDRHQILRAQHRPMRHKAAQQAEGKMCPSHIGMAEGSAEGNGKRGLDKTGNDGAGFAAQARLYQEVQRDMGESW